MSGIPLGVVPVTPKKAEGERQRAGKRRTDADEEALHDEAGPAAASVNLSATNARNGSMLTLMDASRIHSRPAAIQSEEEFGIDEERERWRESRPRENTDAVGRAVPTCDRSSSR